MCAAQRPKIPPDAPIAFIGHKQNDSKLPPTQPAVYTWAKRSCPSFISRLLPRDCMLIEFMSRCNKPEWQNDAVANLHHCPAIILALSFISKPIKLIPV